MTKSNNKTTIRIVFSSTIKPAYKHSSASLRSPSQKTLNDDQRHQWWLLCQRSQKAPALISDVMTVGTSSSIPTKNAALKTVVNDHVINDSWHERIHPDQRTLRWRNLRRSVKSNDSCYMYRPIINGASFSLWSNSLYIIHLPRLRSACCCWLLYPPTQTPHSSSKSHSSGAAAGGVWSLGCCWWSVGLLLDCCID